MWYVVCLSITVYMLSRNRCMGYHSSKANNIPENFTCFDCQVRADRNWDLILVHNLHPRMMDKFKDLALFRYVLLGLSSGE